MSKTTDLADSIIQAHPPAELRDFEKNSRDYVDRLTAIKNEEETLRGGGGPKAVESQHKKQRLTARERIEKLIDHNSPFFELGIYAAYEMYEEWGGAPRREPSPAWGASAAAR